MRKKWFSVEQKIGVLKQAQVGVTVAEVNRDARLPMDSILAPNRVLANFSS